MLTPVLSVGTVGKYVVIGTWPILIREWDLATKSFALVSHCQWEWSGFCSLSAIGMLKYHQSSTYNLDIASLMSVSCIFRDASNSWPCKTLLRCSHISSAKFHRSKMVFLLQFFPWSLDCTVTGCTITTSPQCLLRYPHIARCHPIHSCSSRALITSLHCAVGTWLTSGVSVSRDTSHDLMHHTNSCCTLQVWFHTISWDIERTSSYHLQCALPAGQRSMCSWDSSISLQHGHLWESTASGAILDFCRPVLSHLCTCFEALIRFNGPRVRYKPFIAVQLILFHTASSHPCFHWRYIQCLLPCMCQWIECWKLEVTHFPLTDKHTLELEVKNPPSWIGIISPLSIHSWNLVVSLWASQLFNLKHERWYPHLHSFVIVMHISAESYWSEKWQHVFHNIWWFDWLILYHRIHRSGAKTPQLCWCQTILPE